MKTLPPDQILSAQASLARGTLVAEHAALLMEREDLKRAVTAAHGELEQLLAAASHDLLAPLRGIAHLSGWLEEDIEAALAPALPSPVVADTLKLLRGRVARLERLVGGLLAYSRAGHGKLEEDASELRLAQAPTLFELCETLTRASLDEAYAASAQVRLLAGKGAEVRLAVQPALRMTLGHLLSNAARHGRTDAQTAHVTVSACPAAGTHPAAPMYEVTIADKGPGIEPRHHARIWEPFKTLESRDRCETAGIGLAIVRRVVARVGGLVGLASERGAGAAFRFTWPGSPGAHA